MNSKPPTMFTNETKEESGTTSSAKAMSPADVAVTKEAVHSAYEALTQLIDLVDRTSKNPNTTGNFEALQKAAKDLADLREVIANHPLTPDLSQAEEAAPEAGMGFGAGGVTASSSDDDS